MFTQAIHILLIVSITLCPVMCRLAVCACKDTQPTKACCCSGQDTPDPATNGDPTGKSNDSRIPGKCCICSGAILGDVVDVGLLCHSLSEVALPHIAEFDRVAARDAVRLDESLPDDRSVKSGRMIRHELMSLLC